MKRKECIWKRAFCCFQGAKPGEPLYAQVNREKKKNRQYEGGVAPGPGEVWNYEEQPSGNPVLDGSGGAPAPGGDSWVWTTGTTGQ